MINRKRLMLVIAFISLIISIYFVADTYAKYVTSASGTTNMNLARWKILVNDQDIRADKDISNVVTPVFIENENIGKDVIAPTSEGYFDLIIDASETDVSFNFTINVQNNVDSAVTDLVTTGYSINGSAVTELGTGGITGSVAHTDTDKVKNIRVFIKWEDDADTTTMDNEKDTLATLSASSAKMDVNLSFIQVKNS